MNVMICRLCLDYGVTMNTLLEDENRQLYSKIQTVSPVPILLHDGLPLTVCLDCTEKVESFFMFQQQIKESDAVFKNQLSGETLEAYGNGNTMEVGAVKSHNRVYETKLDHNLRSEYKSVGIKTDFGVNSADNSDNLTALEMCIKVDKQQERAPRAVDTPSQLIKLTDRLHLQNNIYCQICLEQFVTDDVSYLVKHCEGHFKDKGKLQSEPPFTCELCSKMFKTRYEFVTHQRAHLKVKPFQCKKCQCRFGKLSLLDEHASECGIKKTLPCEFCGKLCKNQHILTLHKTIHEDPDCIVCKLCGKLMSNVRTYKEHIRQHSIGKTFICEICSKSYYTKSHLKKHSAVHGSQNLCSFCGKTFVSDSDLTRHLLYHYKRKQFTCRLCEIKFYELSHLKEHVSIKHGNSSCVCEVCGKMFSSERSLKVHRKLHVSVNMDIETGLHNAAKEINEEMLDSNNQENIMSKEALTRRAGFILITEPDQTDVTENDMVTATAEKDVTYYVLAGDKISFDSLRNDQ